jgi:hypothetical protein
MPKYGEDRIRTGDFTGVISWAEFFVADHDVPFLLEGD